MTFLDWFGIVLVVTSAIGVACDVSEHRRLTKSGIRPQLRGPYR